MGKVDREGAIAMQRGVQPGGSEDFAAKFTALLVAAELNPDKLVAELRRRGGPVSVVRNTIYDWRKGQHLPADETSFKTVINVCLDQARKHGNLPPLRDEIAWIRLLHSARHARAFGGRATSQISGRNNHNSSARTAGEWNPGALGVHKAIGGNPVPAFVHRPHDDLLEAALNPVVVGSRLIVLRGGPSTGKSRSAYEAVCKGSLSGWALAYPFVPSELTHLLDEGVESQSVIWLRELRDYADADGGREALAMLARVLTSSSNVVAITTIWPNFWDAYTWDYRGSPGSRDPYAATRALLAGLPELSSVTDAANGRGGVIDVPEEFNDREIVFARQLTDPALTEAVTAAARERKPHRVIQYLAAVPDLLRKYEGPGANPYTKAVITTAMNVARMTRMSRCTPAFLDRAAVAFLSDDCRVNAPADWCKTAVIDSAKELRGAVRALTPVPGKEDTQIWCYRLADYLEQHGRKIFAEQIPPVGFWTAALQSSHEAQGSFGVAAVNHGLLRIGAQLLKNAVAVKPRLALDLVRLMHGLDSRDRRAASWSVERIDIASSGAVALLLNFLREIGADAQVSALLNRDPASQIDVKDTIGVSSLLDALHAVGARTQISSVLSNDLISGVKLDDIDFFYLLPALYAVGEKGQLNDLAELAVADADLEDPYWLGSLLEALHAVGARKQVATLLSRDLSASVDVHSSQESIPDFIEALHLVSRGERLGTLPERSIANINMDDFMTMAELLIVLHKIGKGELVHSVLRTSPARRVDIADPFQVAELLRAFYKIGATSEIEVLLSRDPANNVDLTSLAGFEFLLNQLQEIGAADQVATLLARDLMADADQSNPLELLDLLPTLEDRGDRTSIDAIVDRLPGGGAFAVFLLHSRRADDFRYGREPDGRPALHWDWGELE